MKARNRRLRPPPPPGRKEPWKAPRLRLISLDDTDGGKSPTINNRELTYTNSSTDGEGNVIYTVMYTIGS